MKSCFFQLRAKRFLPESAGFKSCLFDSCFVVGVKAGVLSSGSNVFAASAANPAHGEVLSKASALAKVLPLQTCFACHRLFEQVV